MHTAAPAPDATHLKTKMFVQVKINSWLIYPFTVLFKDLSIVFEFNSAMRLFPSSQHRRKRLCFDPGKRQMSYYRSKPIFG